MTDTPISRRHVIAGCAATAASIWLPPAHAQQAFARGGVLNCAVDTQPKSLDPIMGDAPGVDRYSLLNLYDGLLQLDERGAVQAGLAESWGYSTDRKSITFNLRRGITFHDGTSFDAEAAAFNLRRAIDPAVNAPRASDLGEIASVDVVNPTTLRVNLKAQSGAVLAALASEAGMMSSPTAVKRLGLDYGRNPVGTGPFKFVEWISGTGLRMSRNENYWRMGEDKKSLPYLDGVYLRYINNTAVKMTEVKSGNVLLTDGVTPKDFETIENHPNLYAVTNPGGIAQWISFNTRRAPFDNPKVRAAVNYAINRESLAKAIAGRFGVVYPTLIPRSDWAFDGQLSPVAYDPARARAMLKEAGAEGLSITISIIQRDPDTQLAQFIQAQLRDAGINMRIEVLERQAFVPKVLGHQHDLAMGRVNLPRADPDQLFTPFFGRTAPQNWSGIRDEEVFELVDQARRETIQEKRKQLYSEIQRLILQRDYYAFLFFRELRMPVNKRVQNLKIDISGAWQLATVWLDKA